ncbi:MAG: MFS transporter [Anaerolineae bacterium]|nr:MFS transporter [Anaerolineae bacterium]
MKRHLVPIFVIVLVNFVGSNMVLPTLPLYAQRHFDSSPENITAMLGSYFIALFIAAPVIGRLSDRYGRLPVLIVSQMGTVIGFLILANATAMWQLFLARVLDGITGGNIIVAQAYITDISPRAERTRSLGVVWMAFGVGSIMGPAVGGYLSALADDRAPFWIGALVAALTVVLTRLALRETLTPERRAERMAALSRSGTLSLRDALRQASLLLILVTAYTVQFSMALLTSTFALFGAAVIFSGQPPQVQSLGVGTLLMMIGVGQLLTQLLWIKPLIERYGERRLILVGTLLRAFALLLVAASAFPVVAGLSLLLFASASGIMMPSLQSLATTSVTEERSGAVLGYYQSATSLGIISGTLLGGVLFAAAPQLPFLVGAAILIIVALPAVLRLQRMPVFSPELVPTA